MLPSYELTRLDAHNFEHLVNALALRVLGNGASGFGPGADGGRDGFFEGTAPYPSVVENWSGVWYLQSKFHAPHLSKDPHKWLIEQVKDEISAFKEDDRRKIPDIWIVATNIDPSGVPETGSFDAARKIVSDFDEGLAKRFHIWGGRKILDLLLLNTDVGRHYAQFLTPGDLISELYNYISDEKSSITELMRYLIVTQISEQQYTKLEQAGSGGEGRPGIQRLFTDIPFKNSESAKPQMAAHTMAKAIGQIHKIGETQRHDHAWSAWHRSPRRARVWFIKGGPGQGKSTLTQYMAQIQRAATILSSPDLKLSSQQRAVATDIKTHAESCGYWPNAPRIPFAVELKEYAYWLGKRGADDSTRFISFMADRLSREIASNVGVGLIKRSFKAGRWLFIFDGLDEVPNDVKDSVAREINYFVNDNLIEIDCDALVICTSRPQGYSGQFSGLDAANIELSSLSKEQALACAKPLLEIDRSPAESRQFVELLESALESPSVAEIMTTPLQSHIMAVIVRDGGRPPERRWQLFNKFYEVIKSRESNRNLPDRPLANLMREGDKLLRALHNRLGFELHARAEVSSGAKTAINRHELRVIVRETVVKLQDSDIESTLETLMRATTERLVLVNTPESGDQVKFDIRPLQEFFAAEYLYMGVDAKEFEQKLAVIAHDSHWREVMHFLVSALIENERTSELATAIATLAIIDNGESNDDRIFYIRMARGAIIAARLLSEGVLEQDKQSRMRFREAISLISSSTDARRICSNRFQRHSLHWFQEVLISALNEKSESENIGAAIKLARILPDGHPRAAEVKNKICNSSKNYIWYFISTLSYTYASERTELPEWVVEIVLRAISDDEWHAMPQKALYSAFASLEQNEERSKKAARSIGLSQAWADMIPGLMSSSSHYLSGKQRPRRLYGILGVESLELDPALNFSMFSSEHWTSISHGSGFFKSAYILMKMLSADINDSSAEESFKSEFDKINNEEIPYSVFLIMLNSAEKFLNIKSQLQTEVMPSDRLLNVVSIISTSNNETIDWLGLFDNNFEIFMHVYLEREIYRDANVHEVANLPIDIAGKLIGSGYISRNPSVWGEFLHGDLDRDGRICKAVIEASLRPVIRRMFSRKPTAFKLEMDRDACLIPHLIGAVLDSAEIPEMFEYPGGLNRHTSSISAEICAEAVTFEIQEKGLETIIDSEAFSKRIRYASIVFALMRGAILSQYYADLMVSLYEDSEAHWQLPAAGHALFRSLSSADRLAVGVMSRLLHLSSTNFFARGSLDAVLSALRETSMSPVTVSKSSISW